MDTIDYKAKANELVTIAIEQTFPPDFIRSLALETKKEITEAYIERYNDMLRAINYIDYAISVNAPDPSWRFGWYDSSTEEGTTFTSTVATPRDPRRDRRQRVIAFAQRILSEGASSVRTAEIASELKREGDSANEKNLSVAVGNILSANKWRRIGTGEYWPPATDRERELMEATRQ